MLYLNLVIPRKNLRNKFTIKNVLMFSGVVMQNQIYRGVSHNTISSRISKNFSKINFAYRGIFYLKSFVENKEKNAVNMSYRGVSFKKINS